MQNIALAFIKSASVACAAAFRRYACFATINDLHKGIAMDYLPLFHKLQGRVVLLVGGGEMALRKARLLLETGATLRVVAPLVSDEL